jgi:CheY-like chemotaxis protein/two-component sensor histidine kinase
VIDRNAKAQAQLVGDLLDMSRIMTGKLTVELSPVDLRGIVDSVNEAWKPDAEARSIELTVAKPEETLVVDADSARMHQVLSNLLANAIKFTEPGGHVRLFAEECDGAARLVVQDDGIGITADFLPHVFDRFRQADSATTRSHRGMGLGLAIVRHIVELHGGIVRAESDGKGLGSKFVVEVPLAAEKLAHASPPSAVPASPPRPPAGFEEGGPARLFETRLRTFQERRAECDETSSWDLHGLCVLLVEDDDSASEAVSLLLSRAGARVETAASVAAAMSLLRTWRPGVVVSDIGLPLEDGYSLIRKLRSLAAAEGERIPAIAMTAYAHAEERARVLAEGFDAHLTKPVDGSLLLRTLSRYCQPAVSKSLG